uniref:J domain-containing protein n=1 Tax=Noccaea caerulescens TaxID=107243 RepID=A0A1J3JLT7_NOCCA
MSATATVTTPQSRCFETSLNTSPCISPYTHREAMGEKSQFKTRSGNRMPAKRCSANGTMNEFIVLDDDEDEVLDFPESSKSKATSRTRNGPVLPRVISIDDDDDDDDDETENVHKAGSSSRSAEVDDDDDDCQFVQEKRAAFRLSKCTRTTTMPSSGTRYGLGSESESDFSGSDCSDCEILDLSNEKVREEWEKAFFNKTKKAGKAGLTEEAGPSNLHCDTNFGPRFESRTEQDDQTSSFFAARNPDGGKETSSTFFETEISGKAGLSEEADPKDLDCANVRPDFERRTEQRDQTFSGTEKSGKAPLSEEAGPSDLHHRDSNSGPDFESRTEPCDQTSSFFPARNPDCGKETWSTFFGTEKSGKAGMSEEAGPSNLHRDSNFGPGFDSRNYQRDQTSSFFPARNPDGGKETSSTSFGTDDRSPGFSLFGSRVEVDKEKFPWFSSMAPEIQLEHERSDSPSAHFTSTKEPMHQNSSKEVEEQLDTVQVQCETSQLSKGSKKKKAPKAKQMKKFPKEKQMKKKSPKENQKKKAADQSYTKEVVEEEDASKSAPPQTSDGKGDTTTELGTQSNGARSENGISGLGVSRELTINPIPSTSGQVQGPHDTAPAIDVMLNREMLKETDEYKKAQEEEWESRQQQLQLQAEEAQRQRKRRKLENMRQLEVERRQKERVEEVRETQKKDEESMNLKEKVRAEITKSLKILELKCINMASLLRGLGISVGGGTSPPPNEVHAAYKRAVLKFHPDRASRGDIKLQVEAEEKFKLIARMKDKFLS